MSHHSSIGGQDLESFCFTCLQGINIVYLMPIFVIDLLCGILHRRDNDPHRTCPLPLQHLYNVHVQMLWSLINQYHFVELKAKIINDKYRHKINGSRTISPRTISPRTISPRTTSPRTTSPGQHPPGQYPPWTISPWTISPLDSTPNPRP